MPLSLEERQKFLAEPHIGALSVDAGPGRAPLTVPMWYQYAPGGELWILTEVQSKKMQLIEAAGRFSVMVNRLEPTVRYVTAEGPVTRTAELTDEIRTEIAARYLPENNVPGYLKMAEQQFGASVAVYMRPEHWLSADVGDMREL